MIDLDTRLKSMAVAAPSGPSPNEIRRRAATRRRRRLVTVFSVCALVVGAAALTTVAVIEEPTAEVRSGPGQRPSTTAGPSTPSSGQQRVLGEVAGVSVTVSPSTNLRDGDLVEVRIDGIELLPGPDSILLLCRGDVTVESAPSACDTSAVKRDGTPPAPAESLSTVSLNRVIRVGPDPYDCATEPPGCVLAVGRYDLPVRAVLVPISFAKAPLPTPEATIEPSAGLADRQRVTLTAESLRPNSRFAIALCPLDNTVSCDELAMSRPISDADGSIRAEVTVRAAIYTYQGRIDCTVERCAVVLRDDSLRNHAQVPYTLAPGVVAPAPELSIDPAGPYVDGQTVTVRGTGFPPGFDIARWIGQCPNDKDTALEERCTYGHLLSGSVVVDAEGRFSMEYRLSASLVLTGSCIDGPGCHIGWVLPHGPTAAKAFLEFQR